MADEKELQEGCSPEQCSGCEHAAGCPSNKGSQSFIEEQNIFSDIKHVYGVVSGKGGVGKSFVTGSIAVELARKGFKVGIMDADITGPSIQKMFGIKGSATGDDNGIYPAQTESGIKIMSINMLLEDDTTPVIWRGPVLAGVVKQFWTDVVWGELDYLLVDMPPGTGDVPLTVFQSIPVDGIIVVTSPQDLVSMIVTKAVNMAKLMNVPVLGLVENMSYYECPDCGSRHEIFGPSQAEAVAVANGIKLLEKLPLNPVLAAEADAGKIEFNEGTEMESVLEVLAGLGLEAD